MQSTNIVKLRVIVDGKPWYRHPKKGDISRTFWLGQFVQGTIGANGPQPNDIGHITCHYLGEHAESLAGLLRPHDVLMVKGELQTPDITFGAREGRTDWVELLCHDIAIIGQAKRGPLSKERMSWPIGLDDKGEVKPALPPGMG